MVKEAQNSFTDITKNSENKIKNSEKIYKKNLKKEKIYV